MSRKTGEHDQRNRMRNGQKRLSIEHLENRQMMSVTSATLSQGMVFINTNNYDSNVSVLQSGANIIVKDAVNGFSKSFAASAVQKVQFVGGAGNDRFVDYVFSLTVRAWGGGGNDYLEGYNAADYLQGDNGNDTLVGYGGDDTLFGCAGNDVLLGRTGNDQLVGGDGDDRLNGGDGADKMWGGNGNDVLIAIDGGTSDYCQGDSGANAIWTDKNFVTVDWVYGATAADKVQYVGGFANGADRTLDGDRIADPAAKSGLTYKAFRGNPLFSSAGPRPGDVRQGGLGDCYLMDSPNALRQNVVDFDDGTYGVRLGNSFYRVDNDLPVAGASSTTPAFARLGAENSMWVAAVENAFAHYRTGANSYASIEGGWSVEINLAMGSTSSGARWINGYASAAALANDMYDHWNHYGSTTIGFVKQTNNTGAPLFMSHMYTVMSFVRNSSGTITSIVLRNPWGYDGTGNDGNPNDGLVTVTPGQLFQLRGQVNWGRV